MAHIWMVHSEHKGGTWFADDPVALRLWRARGWVPADPPSEDEPEIEPADGGSSKAKPTRAATKKESE